MPNFRTYCEVLIFYIGSVINLSSLNLNNNDTKSIEMNNRRLQ